MPLLHVTFRYRDAIEFGNAIMLTTPLDVPFRRRAQLSEEVPVLRAVGPCPPVLAYLAPWEPLPRPEGASASRGKGQSALPALPAANRGDGSSTFRRQLGIVAPCWCSACVRFLPGCRVCG